MCADSNCIFCKILSGEIPSDCVYENESVKVIRDLHPIAKYHYLVLPKTHVENYFDPHFANDHSPEFERVLVDMHRAVYAVAEADDFKKHGFRLVQNNGREVGQTVFHLHWHLVAGEDADRGFFEFFKSLV
ncbi:MAG: HIT domain-containing protein [Eubacteriales bacterium]|nr:HIT domain-containing protein [Eubacteriales bacterium]